MAKKYLSKIDNSKVAHCKRPPACVSDKYYLILHHQRINKEINNEASSAERRIVIDKPRQPHHILKLKKISAFKNTNFANDKSKKKLKPELEAFFCNTAR